MVAHRCRTALAVMLAVIVFAPQKDCGAGWRSPRAKSLGMSASAGASSERSPGATASGKIGPDRALAPVAILPQTVNAGSTGARRVLPPESRTVVVEAGARSGARAQPDVPGFQQRPVLWVLRFHI